MGSTQRNIAVEVIFKELKIGKAGPDDYASH